MDSRQLYLLSVKENGISEKTYRRLSLQERSLLQKRGSRYFLLPSERKKFKVVLTGGVFDILHFGHLLTLQKAREHGDLLVAVVATDKQVKKTKKRKPVHNENYRCAMVSFLKPVDLAIVGCDDMLKTFRRVSPDIVAFGYDQKPFPLPCKTVHLSKVKVDENFSKTSKIIQRLGL